MVTTTLQFWMYHEWVDEQGRPWAEPHFYALVSDARRSHDAARDFHWVKAGMHRPTLSALYAKDPAGTVELQPACRPPQSAAPVPSPAGADLVSSVVKAKVQRRDPGSNPGGSTGLPF